MIPRGNPGCAEANRPAAPAPSADALVARDRATMLYEHGTGNLVVTVVASSFLVLMVASPQSRPRLLEWLGVVALVFAARALDVWVLHPIRRAGAFDGRREIALFAAGAMAAALVWGVFPLVFFPVISDTGRTAAAVVLAALAGGSATVLGPSFALAVAFCAVLLLPTGIVFLLLPGRDSQFLGILALAMLAALIVAARVANRTVVDALRLSRVNEALVAQTERQRCETEAANRQLAGAQVALSEANNLLEHRIEARTADLAREVAERQRYAEALAQLAAMDPLTGLCNRTTFAQRLACMLAEAEQCGTSLAVLFLDLDNFKQVNDVRGHATGDRVLQAAAELLSERAGVGVELARWGGDEFVMAMPAGHDPTAAIGLAEDLRRALEAPLNAGLENVRIDVTVGISVFPGDGRTQDELIRAADVAMYEAKKEGKGRTKLFDPALARNVAERHLMEQALRDAIGNGELSLVYQPIVSTRSGRCEAFEALLRWNHPQLGPISPVHFIPIAEQSGQIGAIGRWVLAEACLAAAAWPAAAPSVTVNVSVSQVPVRHAARRYRRRARPQRPAADAPAHRNHRKHVRRRPFARDPGVRGVAPARHAHPARRFRHRVLVAGVSRQAAARRHQDRPELRSRRREGRLRDHPRDPVDRPRALVGRDRRGRRDHRAARHAELARRRAAAGVSARPADAAQRRRGLAGAA